MTPRPGTDAMTRRLFVLALAAGLAHPAAAGDRHYVIPFGSQSVPKLPQFTHTWLTTVRVPGDPAAALEVRTTSWLPAKLVIRDAKLRPEPGVNLTLADTLAFAAKTNQRVSVWGPYEVLPGTYANAVRQWDKVESGFYQYLAVDGLRRDPAVADCIHAVTDADPEFGRRHYPLRRFGESATRYVAGQFYSRRLVIDDDRDHGWLLAKLGVPADVVRRTVRPGGR